MKREILTLYLVTDERWLSGRKLEEDIEKAILGGVTCVQLREKEKGFKEFVAIAQTVKQVCRAYHVPLIINDNVAVMQAVDADGIHVGQDDMNAKEVRSLIGPKKILGVSAHTLQEALQAEAAQADYLGVGAVFGSKTKDDAQLMTSETLKDICQNVSIPVVAIGGIQKENIEKLKGIPLAGVAVVSAIMAQRDIEKAAIILKQKVEEMIG